MRLYRYGLFLCHTPGRRLVILAKYLKGIKKYSNGYYVVDIDIDHAGKFYECVSDDFFYHKIMMLKKINN